MKSTTYLHCLHRVFVAGLMTASLACAANAAPATTAATTEWQTYNKDYQGQRYSQLTEITAQNVGALKDVCRIKVAKGGSFHTGPVVVGGVMYFTTPRSTIAINPQNCALLWRTVYEPEQEEVWAANRGVAFLDGRLFRGTADGRIIALDAKTGKLLWKTAAGNPKQGEFFSSAPIAWNGLLYIGIAGSDWGIQGRMMAFDVATGKEVWRFNTVPNPGEPGSETWERQEALKTGGGGSWGSYALDVERNEVFVPVANPAPDFSPGVRPGANLYTNSVIVLDAKSGKLKWWYQLAPNDGHDYGLGAAPMLFQRSNREDAVALAGKDGFVYVVDRKTHRLLFKTPSTTIENAGLAPTPEGRRFCPGAYGGTEWNGPAFDKARNAIFVGAVDWCSVIKSEQPNYAAGRLFMGGSYKQIGEPRGWVTSIDADTGKINWKYHADAPVVAGITPTAGGLIFTGDLGGNFLALDSKNGKLLHKVNTGGAIAGGVVTYAINGKQYVAITSGNVSRLTFGALGTPTIIIMALNPDKNASPIQLDVSIAEPEPAIKSKGAVHDTVSSVKDKLKMWGTTAWNKAKAVFGGDASTAGTVTANLAHGKNLFSQNCAGCHGAQGDGLSGPSLRNINTRMVPAKTIEFIKNPNAPMPKLYPAILSEQDVSDLAAYLHTF